MKNTEGSCKLNELVSVAANNRLHRNIEEVENLNEPEEARLMAGFFRSTRLQRNKQVQKRNLSAIAHQIYKKRTFTRPNSQKRTRNVFTRLNNYSRKQCAICFERSEGRTGQNSKLSHQKTVNGTRNFFAGREALDKRSASVFPALARDRFLRQFIFQCHNFLIHRRCGVVVPVEHCFHSPSKHTEHNQKSH